jgi:hypothetical protein
MRPIFWDDGTRFDDPNAYWGSPSYVLEPGDLGYVIPPPSPASSSQTHTSPQSMSSNATPVNRTILLALAQNIHAGQLSHGATVGLLHHLAPGMDAAIKKIQGDPAAAPGSAANKGSQLVYRETVDATGEAEAALRDFSDGPAKKWLDGYRKVIEGIHGASANDGWVSAGFPQGKTAVPRKHDARFALLAAARSYLAAHATYEASLPQVTGPALAITAAQALDLHADMQAARTLVSTHTGEQATTKTARDTDVDDLYDEVSGTIGELGDLMGDADARWEVFGLNIPANPSAPGGVASLTLSAAGPGRELCAWDYAVRAEYYRVFLKRVGTDPEAVNVADPKDLEHILKDLTPGSTIEVYIVPMNDGGAGAPSPTVRKVVGV